MLPLALLVDGTMSTPTLIERAGSIGTVQVYPLPGCQPGKYGEQTEIYELPNGVCVNTPVHPKSDEPFLSYKAKIKHGVKASVCFFDVYPLKNCTGNYSGFGWPGGKSSQDNKCQNVLQGSTGLKETFGAESVIFSCVQSCVDSVPP